MAEENEKCGDATAVVAIVLIVILVIAIVIVIIILVIYGSGSSGGAGAGDVQIVNINTGGSGAIPRKGLKGGKPASQVQNQYTIPDIKAIGDSEAMYASIHDTPANGGIMNNDPEARKKKWDPEKNFPSQGPSKRPENSMGAKFGPSEAEMQLYLPTPQELFAAKGHISGPKYIRRGPRYKRGNDWRPIMIPESYKDWETCRRPNRPRIDESYYKEAIEMQERYYKNAIPQILSGK